MKVRLTGVVLAVAVGATSCGSGGSGGTVDRHRFLGEANRICSHFSELQNQVQFPSVNPVAAATTHAARAEWAVALKQVAYLGLQEVKALRKLDAPDALDDRFQRLLATKDAAYSDLLAGADAAKRNRVPGLRTSVAAGRAKLDRAAALATALGARSCR